MIPVHRLLSSGVARSKRESWPAELTSSRSLRFVNGKPRVVMDRLSRLSSPIAMLIAAMKLAQTTWVRRAIAGFARDVEGKVATVVSSLLQNPVYRAPGSIFLNRNALNRFTRSDIDGSCMNFVGLSGIETTLKRRGRVPEHVRILCRLWSVPSFVVFRVLVTRQLLFEEWAVATCHEQDRSKEQHQEGNANHRVDSTPPVGWEHGLQPLHRDLHR